MIVLGVVLIIMAYLLGISILYTLGVILTVIGVLLLVLGSVGHPVGGRQFWY